MTAYAEWSSLTLNGIEVPAMDVAWKPDPQDFAAPKVVECTFRMQCRCKMRKGAWQKLLRSFGPRYWIFRQWKHIQRHCGPGGHRNSKTSRRIIRALQGAS